MILDGGAYASSSRAVTATPHNAAGPYRVRNAHVYGASVRTNNPPCGAMRGFGVPQVTSGTRPRWTGSPRALGMDPVELRARNALAAGDNLEGQPSAARCRPAS